MDAHETPPTAPAKGPLVIAGIDMDAEAEPLPAPAPPVAVARTVVAWVPEGQVLTASGSSQRAPPCEWRLLEKQSLPAQYEEP